MLRTDAEFPFCSERCRLIDLGKWASGDYVISTPVVDPEEMGFKADPGSASSPPTEGHDSSEANRHILPSRRKQ